MRLKDRVALITGASRGIGRAIALRFAQEGARVACFATSEERLQNVSRELKELGAECLSLVGNVADLNACESAVEQTLQQWGKLDVLVNNAGITRDQLLIKMTEEEWDEVINVNLKATAFLTRSALRPMLKARYGRIINMSSVIGLHGQAGQSNYSASKAGIIGFTRSIAKEYGSRGITCNAIAPGFIETDMTRTLPPEMSDPQNLRIPLGRLGKPEDVAGVAAFLASEDAGYITGQVIVVDGGMTL